VFSWRRHFRIVVSFSQFLTLYRVHSTFVSAMARFVLLVVMAVVVACVSGEIPIDHTGAHIISGNQASIRDAHDKSDTDFISGVIHLGIHDKRDTIPSYDSADDVVTDDGVSRQTVPRVFQGEGDVLDAAKGKPLAPDITMSHNPWARHTVIRTDDIPTVIVPPPPPPPFIGMGSQSSPSPSPSLQTCTLDHVDRTEDRAQDPRTFAWIRQWAQHLMSTHEGHVDLDKLDYLFPHTYPFELLYNAKKARWRILECIDDFTRFGYITRLEQDGYRIASLENTCEPSYQYALDMDTCYTVIMPLLFMLDDAEQTCKSLDCAPYMSPAENNAAYGSKVNEDWFLFDAKDRLDEPKYIHSTRADPFVSKRRWWLEKQDSTAKERLSWGREYCPSGDKE